MKKYYLTLLVLGLLFSCNSVYAEPFTGEWRMFVTPDGKEVPDNESSIGLSISQAGTFYNVQVKVPKIPQTPKTTKREGSGWGEFLQASQDQQAQYALQIIKEKFTGKYMLSDDGTTIDHLDGSVSFKYKQTGSMLYSKDLGCFKKGKALFELTGGIENELKVDLRRLRSGLETYKANSKSNKYPKTLDDLWTGTNEDVDSKMFLERIPQDPVYKVNKTYISKAPFSISNTPSQRSNIIPGGGGWVYDPTTGMICVNYRWDDTQIGKPGNTSWGVAYCLW